MVQKKRELAKEALSLALKIRSDNNLELWNPISIFDLVEKLGVELFFTPIKSMEGLYINNGSPTILLSSLRPPGRQVFTCAHELGHHFFKHKFKIDESGYYEAGSPNEEESIANVFAGFLLMPKVAINHAFKKRDINITSATPLEYFLISKNFGVGYSTLINHMRWTLNLIDSKNASILLSNTPKKLKRMLIGKDITADVIKIDKNWFGRPIDICIDDLILFSEKVNFEGKCLEMLSESDLGNIYKGSKVGIGRLSIGKKWTSFVRVSRKEYEGRNLYRHLEE